MEHLEADVVVVGSGMGGGTTAWALARRGVDVLLVERGERLPREPENWSPDEVFMRRRYKPAELWEDGAGSAFAPGVHYVVGGNTKVYGASLPRFRESDFEEVAHLDGVSPAWPFRYADLEPFYGEAERLYAVHGTRRLGPDRAVAEHALPVRRAAARAVRRGAGGAADRRRGEPRLDGDGGRPAPGWAVRAVRDLRRLPVPARRQVGCRGVRRRPRARHRVGPVGDRGPGGAAGHRRVGAAGGGGGRGRAGRAGDGARATVRGVGGCGELGGAAAGVGERRAPRGPRQLLGPARPELHDAQQRAHRRGGREPAQRRGLPEDRDGDRLVPRRRRRPPARHGAGDRQGAGPDDEELGDPGAAAAARRDRAPVGRVGGHGRGPARPGQPGHAVAERTDPHHPGRHQHPPARPAAHPGQAADARRRATTWCSPSPSTSA